MGSEDDWMNDIKKYLECEYYKNNIARFDSFKNKLYYNSFQIISKNPVYKF